MIIDRWMKAAMADDTLVAELLVRIKNSKATASVSAKSVAPPPTPTPPLLRWGAKQPRSRPAVASRSDGVAAVVSRKKDEAASTRYSPTTPLSWSGGASPSTTADGNEESSRLAVHSNRTARSKATATGEYTGNSASTKKCKRKKEIANKNATFKAQRVRNERLKRRKIVLGISLDKPSSSANEHLCTLSDQPQQRIVPSRSLTNATEDDTHPQPQAADSKATRTLIPDLNMTPSEDDSYTDVPSGTC